MAEERSDPMVAESSPTSIHGFSAGDGTTCHHGRPTSKAIAFYNYHSMPITTRVGIEILIKFVTSHISISLLQFFFCCDVRITPPELVECVENTTSCELIHLPYSSHHLDTDIAGRIIRSIPSLTADEYLVILISNAGYFLDCLNRFSEVIIFHPPKAAITFRHYSHRTIQLPDWLEGDVAADDANDNSVASTYSERMSELNRKLQNLVNYLHAFKEKLNKEQLFPDFCQVSCEPIKSLKTIELPQYEITEIEWSEQIVAAVLTEETEEGDEKETTAEDEKPPIRYCGNGWDSFELDPVIIAGKGGGGWDEVDREIEAGKVMRAGKPFQEKKNPFGSNPFAPASGGGGGFRSPAATAMLNSIATYNQDLFDGGRSSGIYHPPAQQKRSPFSTTNENSQIYTFTGGGGRGGRPGFAKSSAPFRQSAPHQMSKLNPFAPSHQPSSPFNSYQQCHRHNPPQQPHSRGRKFSMEKFSNRSSDFDRDFPRLGSTAEPTPSSMSLAAGGNQKNPWQKSNRRNPFSQGDEEMMPAPTTIQLRKNAPQCPQWEDQTHRLANDCFLHHPPKPCLYYPNCCMMAAVCAYGHPFCSEDGCQCEDVKDPQLNHFLVED